MIKTNVDSTAIKSVSHLGGTMMVEYQNGAIYRWQVSESVAAEMVQSDSPGQYLKGVEKTYGPGARVSSGTTPK